MQLLENEASGGHSTRVQQEQECKVGSEQIGSMPQLQWQQL
jgi:hypothetical protein